MLEIKQVGNRYYYFSCRQMRSFPIKKAEALSKLANNEAYLVERFITDPSIVEELKPVEVVTPIQTQSNKVVNFSDRFKAKQEKESFDNAKSHFLNEILPNMNMNEMKQLLDVSSNNGNFAEELMRISLRISIDEASI